MSSPDLSIIIINWRSRDFVRGCLATIFENGKDLTYEVLVVDNASFDGIAAMLAVEFPQVIFIQSEHNLGFSGANNLAFARSNGRTILFLNPDTEVIDDAIQSLVSALDVLPDAGMVGARLLNPDLSLQTTCVTSTPALLNQALSSDILRTAFPRWRLWGMNALFDNDKTPVKVEAISGACMLARRSVLEQVGAFSTEYFMYAEDMDLCTRITQTGSAIYFVPTASIIHHGGGSSSKRPTRDFSSLMVRESLLRFFVLHRGRTYAGLYRATQAFAATVRILLLLIAFPVVLIKGGPSLAGLRIRKWFHIFQWSIGIQRVFPPRPPEPAFPAIERDFDGAPAAPQQ